MIVGAGYPHQMGKMKGEIQNGFLFDYVTGMPYIPGSSLKGVIEDVFQRALEGRKDEQEGYKQYISEALNNKIDDATIRQIWEKSFHGVKNENGDNTEFEPVGERDIFFDAFIVGKDNNCNNIMGIDNITPHKFVKEGEKMELDFDLDHMPLFEPNPITILRIMPGVHFSIRMKLHDVKDDEGNTILTEGKKRKLYYKIIEDFGVGAKTNLGYGCLKPLESVSTKAGLCIKCGKKIEEGQDGNYCQYCAKKRPKCKEHKRKMEWDMEKQDWYCRECGN